MKYPSTVNHRFLAASEVASNPYRRIDPNPSEMHHPPSASRVRNGANGLDRVPIGMHHSHTPSYHTHSHPQHAWRANSNPATPPPPPHNNSNSSNKFTADVTHKHQYGFAPSQAAVSGSTFQPRPPPPQQPSQSHSSTSSPVQSHSHRNKSNFLHASNPPSHAAVSSHIPLTSSSRAATASVASRPIGRDIGGGSGGISTSVPPIPSLHDKVSAALADFENIKSHRHYRPSTAGGMSTRDTSLPRPVLRSSSTHGSNDARHQSDSEPNMSRTIEELRTAKTILRKLYKKNVKLTSDMKKLRAKLHAKEGSSNSHGNDSDPHNDSLHLNESETKLLQLDDGEEEDDADEENDTHRTHSNDDETGSDTSSPRKSSSSSSRSHKSTSKSSSKSKSSIHIGGSNHLLFLLGDRDTTINRLQSQVQMLQRKCHSLTARLEASGSGGGDTTTNSLASSSNDAASSSASAESHLHTLRTNLTARLRSHMTQLASLLSSGQASIPPRALAYIRDLEEWLVWEASSRQVEKMMLNAECMKAEKQVQERYATTAQRRTAQLVH